MQPYPRSPDLVWPGHLHGTGCLSARAVGSGFPTVVRRLCLGPGCGWVWVLLTLPVLAGVLDGRRLLGVPPLGLVTPVPPSPFFRAGLLALFFFVVCVCMFRCPFSRWAAVPGFVLPVLAGWSPCACLEVLSSVPSGLGVLPPVVVLAARLVAVGCFRAPPPLPPPFFGGGEPACSSLCLPWAGARTGPHSVWSSGLLLAPAFCLAVFRPHGSVGLCTRWAGRPFLPG